MTCARLAALFTCLCLVEAHSWEGWHPAAWDHMGTVGIVERTNLFAVPATVAITNWPTASTSVVLTHSFLYDCTAVPETNTLLTGRWSYVVTEWTGPVAMAQTVIVETVGRRVSTNVVLRDAEILSFDCYQALRERYEVLGGDADLVYTNWSFIEKPRFARGQLDALRGYKQWLERFCDRFLDSSAASDGSFAPWFEAHSTNWIWDTVVTTSGLVSLWRQLPYSYTSAPPPYLTSARLCELAGGPVGTNIVTNLVDVAAWTVGVLTQHTVTVSMIVTQHTPALLTWTPARQLSCKGPPAQASYTALVITVGMGQLVPGDPCEWSFIENQPVGTVTTNAWRDEWGVCHVFTGRVGSTQSVCVVNPYVPEGVDIREFGWCKMRDAINALRYTWQTSESWTDSVDHSWALSVGEAGSERTLSLPCSTMGIDIDSSVGTYSQFTVTVHSTTNVTSTVAPLFRTPKGISDTLVYNAWLAEFWSSSSGDDPWSLGGISQTTFSYSVLGPYGGSDSIPVNREARTTFVVQGVQSNRTPGVALYVAWAAEFEADRTSTFAYATSGGPVVAYTPESDCHTQYRDTTQTLTTSVAIASVPIVWTDTQRPWPAPVGQMAAVTSSVVTIGTGDGGTGRVGWVGAASGADALAPSELMIRWSNAYTQSDLWFPGDGCSACFGPFTMTHQIVNSAKWIRHVDTRIRSAGLVILWDTADGFRYK